jgi:D-glycerate 3-kinase
MALHMKFDDVLKDFIEAEKLPVDYIYVARKCFLPLLNQIETHHNRAKKTLLVGINGAQGSGKSTLSGLLNALINQTTQLKSIAISLDDFYLTKEQRIALSLDQHPLFKTRGVPGTHDTQLLTSTIETLKAGLPCTIPRFDKARDDRAAESHSQEVEHTIDVIIFEGWCVGTPAQTEAELAKPINSLEAQEDFYGKWRRYANTQLAGPYKKIFDHIDLMIMLRAPSFDAVFRWRCEQEHKMRERLTQAAQQTNHGADNSTIGMSDAEILRFIQHYQRITEHGLSNLAPLCDVVFELDADRNIQA